MPIFDSAKGDVPWSFMPNTAAAQFGSGSAAARASGNVYTQVSGTGISPGATGADNVLAVFALPAASLDIAGRGLSLMAMGSFANNVNAKRIKIIAGATTAVVGSTIVGGTTIADTGSYSTTGAVGWQLIANIYKYGVTGSNTQICLHESAQMGVTLGALLVPSATTLVESAPILIAVTGNAGTTASDILLNFMEAQALN